MLSRIARARVQVAPARLRRLRAYSLPSNASEGASPVEPGALDVDDAHLLPPDSIVLGSLDDRNPIGDIARALHLPIGDEPRLAEAGFEPPQVIQQAAPEATPADNSASPATPPRPPAESEVFSDAGPASSGSGRIIPSDRALGLEREPTHAEYDKRRVVVEVHNGVRHMANAFAVIRYLERTYGRVSHFNLTRSADVEEDYRGSMFVTFKHPASTQRILQAGILNVQIPEPTRSIPFRPGSVGLDELQDVLMRVPEEFGDAEQQALFDAEASRQTSETEVASAATTEPHESPAKESNDSDVSAHSSATLQAPTQGTIQDSGTSRGSAASSSSMSTGANAAVQARALESNLPKLFLKIQPYKIGFEASEAARFGDVPGDFVRTRPMPGQQFAIGGAFALFSGFSPETASSARMQAVLSKWRPFMPIRPSQPSPSPDQSRPAQETAPADEGTLEQAQPEGLEPAPISLDTLPKPKWQARASQKREREQPAPKQAPVRERVERRPERRQREPAAPVAAKTSTLRPKGAAAVEEALRVAQAANERAAQAAAAGGAAESQDVDGEPAAPVHEEPVAVESKESTWRKLTSRLGSFIGGSASSDSGGHSSSNRK